MHRYVLAAVGLAMLSVALVAQTPPVTGDRSSPLRPLGGEGNVESAMPSFAISRRFASCESVVEPDGTRPIHAHTGSSSICSFQSQAPWS